MKHKCCLFLPPPHIKAKGMFLFLLTQNPWPYNFIITQHTFLEREKLETQITQDHFLLTQITRVLNRHPMAVDTQLTDLYRATLRGQKKEVIKFLNKHNKKIMGEHCPLTLLGDTVLHIAAYNNHEDLFVDLLETSSNDLKFLRRANQLGDTVLHEVATTGSLRMADAVLDKERELMEQMGTTHADNCGELLLSLRNNSGETPLFTATVFGQREMFSYFASKLVPAYVNSHLRSYDGTTVLHVAILRESYDMAYEILRSYQQLAVARDGEGLTGLHFLASISTAFPSGSRLGVLRRSIYSCIPCDNIEPEFDSPDESNEENPNSNLGNPRLPPNYEVCMQLLAMAGSGKWPPRRRGILKRT